jgi:hypothetical protein
MDLTKLGMGATNSINSAGLATGQGVASSYADSAGIDLYKGALQRDFWSGAGTMPLNFMLLKNMFGENATGAGGYPGPKAGY